jgi:hypothetical protein
MRSTNGIFPLLHRFYTYSFIYVDLTFLFDSIKDNSVMGNYFVTFNNKITKTEKSRREVSGEL